MAVKKGVEMVFVKTSWSVRTSVFQKKNPQNVRENRKLCMEMQMEWKGETDNFSIKSNKVLVVSVVALDLVALYLCPCNRQ